MNLWQFINHECFLAFARAGIASNKQAVIKYPNGYGASILPGAFFPNYRAKEYELAVLKFRDGGDYDIVDVLPEGDVLGHINFAQVKQTLLKIKAL